MRFGSDLDGTTIPKVVGTVVGRYKVMDALRSTRYGAASMHKPAHEN